MAKDAVRIDGSLGEGGGQTLRTSLSLACVTGRPLVIERIRAGRPRPGLAAQHLTCVRAARDISAASCGGDAIGSQALEFAPGRIEGGEYRFDIGTAGACSLVLQTVLPPLFFAGRPSVVTVTGGTHNMMAPPHDFLDRTFLPRLRDFGLDAGVQCLRRGFYPAGGGVLRAEIAAARREELRPIEFVHRRGGERLAARIYTSRLPENVASLQRKLLLHCGLPLRDIRHIEAGDAAGPGNCVTLDVIAHGHTSVFTAFGARGKHSSRVIAELMAQVQPFLKSAGAADPHLADQLLLYMALAGGGRITTSEVIAHCRANMEVIRAFLPVNFIVTALPNAWEIACARR